MDHEALRFVQPYFLGPSGENAEPLESLVVEFLRDHVYWRRNLHPEDGLRMGADARIRPDFLEAQAKIRAALYDLSGRLNQAVPFSIHATWAHPLALGSEVPLALDHAAE